MRRGPLADFVDAWEALPLFATQRDLPVARQARQRAARLAHDPQALAWAFEVAGLAQHARPAAGGRRRDAAAAVFLTGALDDALHGAWRPRWRGRPGSGIAVVSGAGHNLLLEAPAAVAASLLDLMENP